MTFRSMLTGAALALIAAAAAQSDADAPLPGTSLYNLGSQWVTQDGAAHRALLAERQAGRRGNGLRRLQGHLSCHRR